MTLCFPWQPMMNNLHPVRNKSKDFGPDLLPYQQSNESVGVLDLTETVLYPDTSSTTFILRQYALPLICLVGFVGNTMAACTFLGKHLRAASCSMFLAVRSISDNGFIISLLVAWLDFIDVHLYHMDGICQIIPFLSYVCSFISVWCVVFVTGENYVRMCQPMNVTDLCSVRNAKKLIISSVFVSLVLYNFPLWGVEVQALGGRLQCMTKQDTTMLTIELVITYLDTVFTLLIPLSLILVFMCLILCSAAKASRRHLRRQINNNNNSTCTTRRVLPHTHVTRLMTSVSTVFVILHTPLHAIRLKVLIYNQIWGYQQATASDRTFQHLFVTMFYMNFSINCFIYLLVGRNFRHKFKDMFCKCKLKCRLISPEDEGYLEDRLSGGLTTSTLMLDREEETTTWPNHRFHLNIWSHKLHLL